MINNKKQKYKALVDRAYKRNKKENKMNLNRWSIKDIVLIPILACIIFVQEWALSFIPNIQLTVLLIVVISKLQKNFLKTITVIFLYVLIDSLFSGYFNIIFLIAMFVGWSLIPIMLSTIFKNVKNITLLSLIGALASFLYCWVLAIPSSIMFGTPLLVYLEMDITFEIIMAVSSYISISLLFEPLLKSLQIVNGDNDDGI